MGDEQVEMQIAIATLTRTVEHSQVLSREQHAENLTRLDRIETEVRRTNGRVTRLEEQVKSLWRALKRGVSKPEDGEQGGISRRDVAVFLAGGAGLLAAWKFVTEAIEILR